MLKADIRNFYKEKRLHYSEDFINTQSAKIAHNLLGWSVFNTSKYIHTFLPIVRHKEPNMWLLIRKVWEENLPIQWVVSVSDFKTKSLIHYELNPDTVLQNNQWGISEPLNATPFAPQRIELVLIPLLAFDKLGFRVGYGQGFYDRFLAQCPQAIKVGISLEPVLEQPIEDVNQYDIPLDYCITPTSIEHFLKHS